MHGIEKPLEEVIRGRFLPTLLGTNDMSDIVRDLYALPTSEGGLAVDNPVTIRLRRLKSDDRGIGGVLDSV